MTRPIAIALAVCWINPLAGQSLSAEWEKFADGSTGQVTEFRGVGGTVIPAYIRKPAGKGPSPVVVFLHGNTYSKEDTLRMGRSTGHPTEDFVQAGWAVFSIDFRPNPPLPQFDSREWEDTALAIKFVRQMPFIDGERVAVEGGSHGANVLSRVVSRLGVRCAVLCAPAAIDLIEISHAVARGEKVNPQLNRYIASLEKHSNAKIEEIERDPAKFDYSSAFTEVAGVKCPMLIINGQNDNASPISVVDPYVEKLRTAGKHVETWFPENGPHGFYVAWPREIPETAESARRSVEFIRTYFNAGGAPFEQLSRLYDYDGKEPLDLRESGVETRGEIQVHDISYSSPLGGRVSASLFVPPGRGPFAGMILMHGGGGNRGQMAGAATMFARTGAVCLTIDAPFSGPRAIPGQEIQDWEHAERSTGGLIQNVIDLRRGVDLLVSRPDVDPTRLGFYAGSFGAITGGVLAGVEHRIKAYVLMSLPASFNDALVERRLRVSRSMSKEEFERNSSIIETGAPVYYVGHATPSALLIQIGEKDTSIPRESAERLYNAASEPKLYRRYDGGHGLNNQARLDSAEWLRKVIGIGPLDPADQKRLSSPAK